MEVNFAQLEPIGDYVVIKRNPKPEQQEGKIVLPDAFADKNTYGTVVAVGPGLLRINPLPDSDRVPMQCKVGDTVIMPHEENVQLDPDDRTSMVLVVHENSIPFIWHKA